MNSTPSVLEQNQVNQSVIYCGDNVKILKTYENCIFDLTVTSPPYDNLRNYGGYSFNFESIAKELYRVTKFGGVVVWIVQDKTHKGNESGTSFKQVLYFKEIGFNLHDTMIWNKGNFTDTGSLKVRYGNVFDYMFILTKGRINTFNPIKDRKNKNSGTYQHGTVVQKDGSKKQVSTHNKKRFNEYGQRHNIWNITPCKQRQIKHPARFPEKLVYDHILSWSNENDLILDPFAGSGTTLKIANELNRDCIGIEINPEYCEIIHQRTIRRETQ